MIVHRGRAQRQPLQGVTQGRAIHVVFSRMLPAHRVHVPPVPSISAFAGPCCGGLSEQAALARYPTSAQCRLKEGQEWLTSLRTEQRLKTQQGWRGQVLLCGGVASDASASSVRCYVAWHRPPIHEYFCDTRGMQVDFSASYWGPWSRKKALLPLARRGALRGRCAPSSRRWGDMGLRGVAWGCMGLRIVRPALLGALRSGKHCRWSGRCRPRRGTSSARTASSDQASCRRRRRCAARAVSSTPSTWLPATTSGTLC